MDGLNIRSMVQYAGDRLVHDGVELFRAEAGASDPLRACYTAIALNDPKFFKMDAASKLVLLAAEPLFRTHAEELSTVRDHIGLVLGSRHGCADVDERYWQSAQDLASPALETGWSS